MSGETNATRKYADDAILDDHGQPICWDEAGCKQACEESADFYGMIRPDGTTNGYGKELDAYVDKVFELGCDGICAPNRPRCSMHLQTDSAATCRVFGLDGAESCCLVHSCRIRSLSVSWH